MSRKSSVSAGRLPPPTSEKNRRTVLAACERWNRMILPSADGTPPSPVERGAFANLTNSLIVWRNDYAEHLDTAPLIDANELIREQVEAAGPGVLVTVSDDRATRVALRKAVAAVNGVILWLKGPVARDAGDNPTSPYLSTKAIDILATLLTRRAFTAAARVSRPAVVKAINRMHDLDGYRRAFDDLRQLSYTAAAGGRDGGLWLTPAGRRRADAEQAAAK